MKIRIEDNHNIISDLQHAATTLTDDPGNHKKKALLGAALTAGGVALAVRTGNKLGKQPQSLVQTLVSSSIPAGIYYAIQNRDNPKKSLMGLGATGAAIAVNSHYNPYKDFTPDKDIASKGVGITAAVLPAVYTIHQLQKMRDREKLNYIKNTTELSPIEKAEEINRIKMRKDLYTKYPLTRVLPLSERLRSEYNEMHPVSSVISPKDAVEYGILSEDEVLNYKQKESI